MFVDRKHAGEMLAKKLRVMSPDKDAIVLAIPRGGVVVGKEVARALGILLDTVVVRKIGAPHNPELAIGAVGASGIVYWDTHLCKGLGITGEEKERQKKIALGQLAERERSFRKEGKIDIRGKTVLLVDDGVATGASVIAAGRAVRKKQAKRIVLAVPVMPQDIFRQLAGEFDTIIALRIEDNFVAVGNFYENFQEVSDEEVVKLLASSS